VGRAAIVVKQKSQAAAAFLGILPIPANVLRACCILTTILPGFSRIQPASELEKATPAADRAGACGRINLPVKIRLRSPPGLAEGLTKKAAARDAAAGLKGSLLAA
jgi:hypothetical protein